MGLVQFSLELNQWRLQKEFWQLVIWRKLGQQVHSTTICHMAACLHITDPLATMLRATKEFFQQASEKYEELKPKHEVLCQSFLSVRLQDPTITDVQQVVISQLVAKEQVRNAYWQIWALKGILVSMSISQVEITEPQGTHLVTNC